MKPLFIKKNGTVSKVSGIIMNLIPSYTLAEYNALTHKPLLWVRTDEEYAQIPSEDVSYGSGSVKDALDELTSSIMNTVVTNNGLTFRFYKQGHLAAVTLASGSATSSVAAGGKLVDIPNGYKPCAEGFQTSIAFGHTGRAVMMLGGVINIQDAMSAGATPRFSITYICE